MVNRDDERLRFVPHEKAVKPIHGPCYCYVDMYWCVDDQGSLMFWRPGKSGVVYAQCTFSRALTETIRDRLYPWAEVSHIPLVFTPLE